MNKPRRRNQRRPLSIAYDPIKDTLTVNGITFAGVLFRTLAFLNFDLVYRPTTEIIDGQRVIRLHDLTISEYLTRGGNLSPN